MWHYGHSGQQAGPIPTEELIALCRSGAIPMSTLVWREGMAQWVPLPQAPELMAELHRLGSAPGAAPVLPMAPAPASAIASIICGSLAVLGSCIFWGGILSIPAIITGHIALRTIKRSPTPMDGRGLAIAGLVMGYLILACGIALITIFVIAIMSGSSASGHGSFSFPFSPPRAPSAPVSPTI
jgi:GYF domain 2/Domain of unknown function (DUF4190)